MATAKALIRKTLSNRWALSALLLALVVGGVYLGWGEMGLAGLGGGAVGVVIALMIGQSKPWTSEDQADHDRRWKWDGSSNDDNLSQ